MAKAKRAKRIRADDARESSERAADNLTDMATAAGTQAVQFVAAVARGMAKGIAGAARELRGPASDLAESATKATREVVDSAASEVKRAPRRRRAVATGRRRSTRTTRRRSA
jgi:hypothetical protein